MIVSVDRCGSSFAACTCVSQAFLLFLGRWGDEEDAIREVLCFCVVRREGG